MNNYERRWQHAFKWAKKLKELFDTGNYLLVYDEVGTFDYKSTRIVINEDKRTIHIVEMNCSWMVYDGDLDYDHGAYTPIKEFKENVINRYTLYKKELIKI